MSLIAPDQHFALIALLFLFIVFSIVGENRGWFGTISGVLVTITLAAIATSVGIIPSGADTTVSVPVYDFAFTYLIPFSIPLLLFNVHFKQIIKGSGRLMGIFLIGAVGVVLGALLAGLILDVGEETHKLAAVYTATYTGGSVNFMAVAGIFDFFDSPLFAASVVVDNTFTIFYIMLLFLFPRMPFFQKHFPMLSKYEKAVTEVEEVPQQAEKDLLFEFAACFAIASVIVVLGKWTAPLLQKAFQLEIELDLLIITFIILLAANLFPKPLQQLEQTAFQLGMLMLYFFLGVIGATCKISELFNASPKVLLFAIITLVVHLAVTLLVGKWFKYGIEEIAIASGANAGGVSISAPMAATFQLKGAVTPAILIGIMGYVVGTFLGLGVGLLLNLI